MSEKRLLRILYTINSSPQYILARSHSLVPVTLITNNTGRRYATVSLKICLDTLCRSSPELVQDNSRDYSVYVLDPLEAGYSTGQNVASSSSDPTAQAAGVAVALGLMSWALHTEESDSMPVTGTIIQQPTGQDALEVIFSLREVRSFFPHAYSCSKALIYTIDCCNAEDFSSGSSPFMGTSL